MKPTNKSIVFRFLTLIAIISAIILLSCTLSEKENGIVSKTETPINVIESTSTSIQNPNKISEILWPTQPITATPLNLRSISPDVLNKLFERLYLITSCRIDLLAGPLGPMPTEMFKAPKPVFVEIDVHLNVYLQSIIEIADNVDKTYQAFVACENREICHPKIFLKSNIEGKIYEIDWEESGGGRPIQSLIWINHDVLIYNYLSSPIGSNIIAVDVTKKDFVYNSFYYYYCPTKNVPK